MENGDGSESTQEGLGGMTAPCMSLQPFLDPCGKEAIVSIFIFTGQFPWYETGKNLLQRSRKITA